MKVKINFNKKDSVMYDSNGRIVTVKTDDNKKLNTYEYNKDGLCVRQCELVRIDNVLTDSKEFHILYETDFAYDEKGRCIKESYRDGSYTEYSYNDKNNSVCSIAYGDDVNEITFVRRNEKGDTLIEYSMLCDMDITEYDKDGNTIRSSSYNLGNILLNTLDLDKLYKGEGEE